MKNKLSSLLILSVLLPATVQLTSAQVDPWADPIVYPIGGSFVANAVNPPQPYRHFEPDMLSKSYDYHVNVLIFEEVCAFDYIVFVYNVGSASYSTVTTYLDGRVDTSDASTATGTEQLLFPMWDPVTGEPSLANVFNIIQPGERFLRVLGRDPFSWFGNPEFISGTESSGGDPGFIYNWSWNFSGMTSSVVPTQSSNGILFDEQVDQEVASCSLSVAWNLWNFFDWNLPSKRFPGYGFITWLPGIPYNGEYKRIQGFILNPNP